MFTSLTPPPHQPQPFDLFPLPEIVSPGDPEEVENFQWTLRHLQMGLFRDVARNLRWLAEEQAELTAEGSLVVFDPAELIAGVLATVTLENVMAFGKAEADGVAAQGAWLAEQERVVVRKKGAPGTFNTWHRPVVLEDVAATLCGQVIEGDWESAKITDEDVYKAHCCRKCVPDFRKLREMVDALPEQFGRRLRAAQKRAQKAAAQAAPLAILVDEDGTVLDGQHRSMPEL